MNNTKDTNIVEFDPKASVPSSTCAVCGILRPFGAFCEGCIGSLLDLALLADRDEGYPRLLDENQACGEALPSPGFLRYNHFEVHRTPSGVPWELGRGSMGVTYKAFDTDLHRVVALKVIHPAILGEVQAGELFLREARSAAQIRHQNIATIYNLGHTEGGDYFYAMEFVEGETLEEYVRREGALHPELALSLVAQAARGLCSAHARGFVHRDLKPTNIMLAAGGQSPGEEIVVKLIDFGLVKAITDEASDIIRLGYFAGTPHYASPEQLEGRHVGVLSDIYSLGRCLWFMLAGQMPTSRVAVEAEYPVDVPPCVQELLQIMVAVDPGQRPQSAMALLGMVDDCLLVFRGRSNQPDTTSVTQSNALSGQGGYKTKVWMLLAGVLLSMVGLTVFVNKAHATREARVLYARGEDLRQHYTKADNQRAEELFSKAILADPDFADPHAALAMTLYHDVAVFGAPPAGLDRAIESAKHALAINPSTPIAFHALGAIKFSQNHPWEALGELHRALELDPGYLPAARDFANMWIAVGQPQLGLAWAKTAARSQPTNLFGWTAAAEAYTDLCVDDEAEDCYRRCLASNPMFMLAHGGLIHIHLWQGDFVRAKEDVVAAEAIQAPGLLILTLKGELELFSGHYQEADAIYQRLLAIDRKGFINYYGGISFLSALGFIKCQEGQTSEGQQLLEEAARLYVENSDGPQAVYNLAAIRSIQGRKEEAISLLEQAVTAGWLDYRVMRLDPRFQAIRENPHFQSMVADLCTKVAGLRIEAEALCSKPLRIGDYPAQPPRK